MPTAEYHHKVYDIDGVLISDEVTVVDITEEANRATIDAAFLTFIDGATVALANLQQIIDTPQPTVTTFPQAQAAIRGLQTQLKSNSTTTQNLIRKTVALARYVSNNLDSVENT